MSNSGSVGPPPGKSPTWDFYRESPRRARVMSYAQAILDGRKPEGPEDEIAEARRFADAARKRS